MYYFLYWVFYYCSMFIERKEEMTYIYDIVLNFTDVNRYFDVYEWEKDDHLVNIKKALILRVNNKVLNDFIKYKIKVNKTFLEFIKDKSMCYKKDKIKYLVILSNGEKSVGFSFDELGNLLYKSSLLFDEEEIINKMALKIDKTDIIYTNYDNEYDFSLPRHFLEKNKYVNKELKSLYNLKKYEELRYIYYEIFNAIENDNKLIYERLLNYKEYINKYDYLYNLILSFNKKSIF